MTSVRKEAESSISMVMGRSLMGPSCAEGGDFWQAEMRREQRLRARRERMWVGFMIFVGMGGGW